MNIDKKTSFPNKIFWVILLLSFEESFSDRSHYEEEYSKRRPKRFTNRRDSYGALNRRETSRILTRSFKPLIGVILFGIVYMLPIAKYNPTAHTCAALVAMICFYWISETIPPFATSYLIPIIATFFQIGYDKEAGTRLSSSETAKVFASKFMDPVIFVFLGSLTLSTALAKLDITTRLSEEVLKRTKPTKSIVLLVMMLINVSIASILSNVASSTLVLSLAMPIIDNSEPNDPYIKALLLGICWSGNCGGMATLISSPQNTLAAAALSKIGVDISFAKWLFFGTPVAFFLVLVQWFYLCFIFVKSERSPLTLTGNKKAKDPWSIHHTMASIVSVVTIGMWTLSDKLPFLGHNGIAALIPVVWFFGTGVLTLNEFNSFKWSTLALLGGGLALGEAMQISCLLDMIGEIMKPMLQGVSLHVILIIILVSEGVIASLLSSTTAASVLFPLIIAVSEQTGKAPLLVVLSALMISGAQLFHISSFPNALVSSVTGTMPNGAMGSPYLSGSDFIVYGWPTIVMVIITISTLGFMLVSIVRL